MADVVILQRRTPGTKVALKRASRLAALDRARSQEGHMPENTLIARIERALTEEAGFYVAVEASDSAIVLTGLVDSPESSRAAEDIVARIAPGARIDNNLEVEAIVPQDAAEFNAADPTYLQPPEDVAEITYDGADIEPDFTDQPLETTGIEDFAE